MTVKKEECLYQGTIKGSDIDTLRLAKSSSSKENCETERMKIDHTLCFLQYFIILRIYHCNEYAYLSNP